MLPDLIARSLHRFIDRSNSRAHNPSDNNTLTVGQQNQDHEFLLNMLLQSISPDSCNLTSNPHILNLIHKLYNLEQGNTPTTTYLHRAKHLADQLAVAGRPVTLSEFNIFALKGLRPEFKDLAITLAARPGPVSFPELHSLLLSHEFIHGGDSFSCLPLPQPSSINDLPISTDYHAHRLSTDHSGGPDKGPSLIPRPISGPNRNSSDDNVSRFCQWCSTPGHTAKSCHFLQQHNSLTETRAVDQDYGSNHDQHLISTMEKRNSTVAMKNSKIQHIEDEIVHINLKGDDSIVKRMKDGDQKDNSKAKDDNSGINRDDFPEDFVFGTATSSYQFEGAAAQGGRGLGVWDVFTMETPDRIFDGTNGNVAVDMYNRYKEDVEMMKKMGFDACRISISWPRILPGGRRTAGINREGINFYNDLVNTLLAHGIEPYVTLFHWDLPYCLEKEYDGFLSKQIVDDFREFVELCFWEFGDRVKSWITLNEPWSYCTSGYVSGKFPPSKPAAPADKIGNNLTTYRAIHDPKLTVPANHSHFNSKLKSDPAKDAYTVARNLLLAHSAAVHSYRTKFQEHQEGKIGIVLCCQWYEPFDINSEEDVAASKRAMDFMMGWFLEPVLTGRYPQSMINFVCPDNLAQFSEEESQMLKGSIDFMGLNYYTANYVANDISPNSEKAYYKDQQVAFHTEKDGKPIGPLGGSTWLYIVPWGVYKLLKHMKDTYKDMPPIYITENGLDEKYDCKLTAVDVCADKTRVKYHQDHLAYIRKAMNENVNVKGYFVWAYCDNFEWYEGFTVRFGLIYIDYMNNLTRYPKSSAIWFTKFLRKRRHTKKKNKISDNMSRENIKFIKD